MKFLKVGFSNSTRMSMSLASFCSPRAKDPKRPIRFSAKLALMQLPWLLRRSIISIFCPLLKALLFADPLANSASFGLGARRPPPARARLGRASCGCAGAGQRRTAGARGGVPRKAGRAELARPAGQRDERGHRSFDRKTYNPRELIRFVIEGASDDY